jgi:ABC-2 type transport system ATP-binding protein
MAQAIEVSGLTKRFGEVLAVDDLSFTVDEGRIVGFLGPNGAGKTTTLRMLLGLVNPTAGSSTVFGTPYQQLNDPVHTVGAVLDGGMLHPGRTGRNHLLALAKEAGVPSPRVDELLELVALTDAANRRAGGYSLGMRQRLGLATALLGDPEVLVLDEPANGLDPQGIRWLRDFLRAQATDGRTVLVSSHVLAEMAQTVDEVVVISRGRLVAQGSLDELTAGTEAPVWVRSPEHERLRTALAAQNGITAEPGEAAGGWLAVRGASLETVGTTAAENGIAVFELYRPRQSLENVFLELTSGTEAGR